MELYIRKIFSFLHVSFLFEIYMKKRKIFRMYNSIMRIESVVGSFLDVIVRLMFGRLLTTQSNVHKFLLALKKCVSHLSFEC